jgi:serine/threonine protein kinase
MDAGPDSQASSEGAPFTAPPVEEVARLFPQLEVLGLIGQGGMGAVYRARQKELDRVVALKVLPPDIGRDRTFAERFTREARALAKLNHAGIVTLYEFGVADGLFFFLMEFVDGVNLRQLLERGRLSPREALAIVPQVCDALQYAHDQGIVHRDIKPENILLDRQGRVKLADFGVAKLVGRGNEPESGVVAGAGPASLMTEAGKVMGTPQYMAPEQRERPHDVDHRADIYSLGVVFYQMLTGELPGRKLEPPSNKVRIDVRLDEVVLRALEQEPERRYQQASVLKTHVETIAETPRGSNRTRDLASATPPSLTANESGHLPTVEATFTRQRQAAWTALALLLIGVLGITVELAWQRHDKLVLFAVATALGFSLALALVAHRESLGRWVGISTVGVIAALALNVTLLTRIADQARHRAAAKILDAQAQQQRQIEADIKLARYLPQLRGTNADARNVAASTIHNLGPLAEPAIPDLIQVLNCDDRVVRLLAATTLGNLEPRERPWVTEALTSTLRDPDQSVRFSAALALLKQNPVTTTPLPVLMEVLTNRPPDDAANLWPIRRREALEALGKMGDRATTALALLRSLTPDPLVQATIDNIENHSSKLSSAGRGRSSKAKTKGKEEPSSASTFAPVVERVVNTHDGTASVSQGLNFKSGTQYSVPLRQFVTDDPHPRWVSDREVDFTVVNEGRSHWKLFGPDLRLARVSNDQWDQPVPEALDDALAGSVMETEGGWSFYEINNPLKTPLTFAFRARSGVMGVLQLTGYNEHPRGINLRYKLLNDRTGAKAPGQTTPSLAVDPEEFLIWHEAAKPNPMALDIFEDRIFTDPTVLMCRLTALNKQKALPSILVRLGPAEWAKSDGGKVKDQSNALQVTWRRVCQVKGTMPSPSGGS